MPELRVLREMRAMQLPAHWRPWLATWAVLLVALLLLYGNTAIGMAGIWSRSDTYAHGFVVPLISAWLVWRQRAVLAPMQPRPAPLAWLLMLGMAGLWLAGDLVAVNAATQFALVALIVLSVPAVLGWAVARQLAFPLGFLFFAVPIGDFMLPMLMEHTADFTVAALRATGVPVYREGLQFVIPSGSWSVVEACSGIRYLIASVTVGSLFAHLSYRSRTRQLVFVGVSIAVPLVANWLRAYMIVMIGHLSGNELATGVDHLVYGWVFFGVVIVIMLWIGARWADQTGPVAVGAGANGTVAMSPPPGAGTARPAWLGAAAAVLLVLVLPHAANAVIAMGTRSDAVAPVVVAAQGAWRETPVPSDWVPDFDHASAASHQGYAQPSGPPVGLHLHYYRQQDYQRKLVSSENVLVRSDDELWARVSGGSAQAEAGQGTISVSAAVLRDARSGLTTAGAARLRVWRWYWVNDTYTASDAVAKVQGALGRLRFWGDDGAIIALYTPMDTSMPEQQAREQADARLGQFVREHGPALQAALRARHAGR